MRDITAVVGQRVAVIRRAFSSVPIDYRFSARVAVPGQVLSGSVEVRKSRWLFPGTPATFPLLENNVVSAGLWNTFMMVDVTPNVDVVITTDSWRISGTRVFLIVLALVVALSVAGIVMFAL